MFYFEIIKAYLFTIWRKICLVLYAATEGLYLEPHVQAFKKAKSRFTRWGDIGVLAYRLDHCEHIREFPGTQPHKPQKYSWKEIVEKDFKSIHGQYEKYLETRRKFNGE